MAEKRSAEFFYNYYQAFGLTQTTGIDLPYEAKGISKTQQEMEQVEKMCIRDRCMAVCSGKITCEAYNEAVQGALRMIRYGKKDIVKQLKEKMQAASDRLDFETAALLRDQIAAIDRVAAGQKVVMDCLLYTSRCV